MKKERLDVLLVQLGLVPSREVAQGLILRGDVLVKDVPCDKCGTKLDPSVPIRIRGEVSRYVGRGGEKLEGALEDLEVDPKGLVGLDIGASTGGFTHCLLEHGAELVYAIDVGTNQLDVRLRRDPRVVVREQTHVRDLKIEEFERKPQILVVDVSFIGIRKILPFILPIMQPPWVGLVLVKPQFELEPEHIEKGGVVRDEKLQLRAVEMVKEEAEKHGCAAGPFAPSRLRGGKAGNQEYFLKLQVLSTTDRTG